MASANSVVDVVVTVTDREPPLRLSYAFEEVKDLSMQVFMTNHLPADAGIPDDEQILFGGERIRQFDLGLMSYMVPNGRELTLRRGVRVDYVTFSKGQWHPD